VSGARAAAIEPEDEARAAIYGLISRLFHAAPDQDLLAQLLHANAFAGGGNALATAWQPIIDACRAAYPVKLENEHTELFVGTGKSEVTPYLTHYVIRHSVENPLVQLRQQFAEWGIQRHQSVGEPEDHIAGVCEAMRFAIAVQHRSIEEQKFFFDKFVYPGGTAFCDAVTASGKADFYRLVARFATTFFEVEREAFQLT